MRALGAPIKYVLGATLVAAALVIPLASSSAATSPAVSAARNADAGFPLWYQDASGIRVEGCLHPSDAQCVLPAAGEEPGFDPAAPVNFPGNFPSEFFYWLADTQVDTTGCDGTTSGRIRLRLAVEGAFANGDPIPNDQMVFGRVRIVAAPGALCPNTSYSFTHPYGVETLTTDGSGAIPASVGTKDIGCVPTPGHPCDFADALASPVFGGFLRWPDDPADPAPTGYLGDFGVAHVVTGSPTGTNLFRVSDQNGVTVAENALFNVSGRVAGPLVGSTSRLEFGGVVAGSSSGSRTITLTNVGADDLALSDLSVTGDNAAEFAVTPNGCAAAVLAQDGSCTLSVTFSPAAGAAGRRNAALLVAHDRNGSPLVIALTGTAIAADASASISTDPASVSFGSQRLRIVSVVRSVTVTNDVAATAPLGITSVDIRGTDSNEFSVAHDPCTGRFLDAGQSCTIGVSFDPTVLGPREAHLAIDSNDPEGGVTVPLDGVGIGGVAAVSSERLFGFATWYRDEAGIRLAPCIDGTDPNCVLPAAGEEPDWDPGLPPTFGPQLNFPSEFFWAVADSDIINTTGCGGRTQPGRAFIRVALEGAFSNEGPVDGEQIAFGRIRVVVTSGLCPNRTYEFVNPYGVETFTTNSAGQVTRSGGTEDIGCFPVAPAVCDFAEPLQSRVLSGFLRWDPSVAPAAPAGYIGDAVTPHRVTGGTFVPEGQTAPANYFEIRDPATGASLGRTSLWTVAGKLSGPLVASPDQIDFDSQPIGMTSDPRTATLTNEGTAAITVGALALRGANAAEYALPADGDHCTGVTLQPTETCTVGVTITPADTGTRTASLDVTHSGLNSPLSVRLRAIGRTAPPALNASPNALQFDSQRVGTTSGAQTVTVDNIGGGLPLDVTAASISGADAASFAIAGEACITPVIPVDGRCAIEITFSPTAAGSVSATLEIAGADESGHPVPSRHVTLTGDGFRGNAGVSSALDANGFPMYYQDGNGVRLTSCIDPADPNCIVLADDFFNPDLPLSFPGNFPTEYFYALADSDMVPTPGCGGTAPGNAFIRVAAEASFIDGAPAVGDQSTFGRVRISVTSGLCPNTTYQFVHPYGTETFTTNAAGGIARNAGTEDIGCGAAPCDFAEALQSRVFGAFLRWDPSFGAAPAGYLGDAVTLHRVTGSPTGNNLFRIVGPGNVTVGETNLFTVMGKLAGPLVATPSALDVGDQQVNTTSPSRTVTIRNVGSAALDLGLVDLPAGAFAIANDLCSNTSLAAGGSCTLQLTFSPTAAGAAGVTLSLPSSAPNSPLTVDLTGNGGDSTPPSVTVSAPLDAATVSGSAVAVSADATDSVGVAGVQFELDGADLGAEVTSAPFSVSWDTTASSNGSHTLTAIARDTAGNTTTSSTVTVTVHNVPPAPTPSLSASSVAFGDQLVGTVSTGKDVTVTNIGAAPLSISGLTLTGTDATAFAASGCTGQVLSTGGSCVISVTFDAGIAGPRTASLAIASNAGSSPTTVALTGTGVQPEASLSTTAVAFGDQVVNTTSAVPQTVTLTNTGGAPLTFAASIGGANAADFARSGGTCAASLGAGDSCTVDITFTPSAVTPRTATLTFTSNAASSPGTVALSGTGVPVPAPVVNLSTAALAFGNQVLNTTSAAQTVTMTNTGNASLTFTAAMTGTNPANFTRSGGSCTTTLAAGASCTFAVTFRPNALGGRSAALRITSNAASSPDTVALSGTGVATATPGLAITPAALDFGDQALNTTSAPQMLTLTNTGNALLTFSTSIGGTNPANFSRSGGTCVSPLAAGASCTMGVTFRPNALGPRTATLRIDNNAPTGRRNISLAGAGVSTTDTVAPVTQAPVRTLSQGVQLLQQTVPVTLDWSGIDVGTGIASFQLQQTTNGGATWTNVALPSPTATTINRPLAPGATVYEFRVRATDVAGNVGAFATGAPFTVTAVQDGTPSIVNSGVWSAQNGGGLYGGTAQSTQGPARASHTFTGKAIAWVSGVGPNRGIGIVFIDGTQVATVDLYAPTLANRRMVFTALLAPGVHTIEVRSAHTRNAASTGFRVDVDAFIISS